MERAHRILQLMILFKIIDVSEFYAISLYEPDINLQGYFKNTSLVKRLNKLKFNLMIDEQGFASGSRFIQGINVRITLT